MSTIFKKNFINDAELERQKKFKFLEGKTIKSVTSNAVNELVFILENGDEVQIMTEIGDYRIPFLYVEDVIPKKTSYVSSNTKDEVIIAAQKLYVDYVYSTDINSNRFPSWNELTDSQRFEYIAKALDVKS
jgi:hypothetical protein